MSIRGSEYIKRITACMRQRCIITLLPRQSPLINQIARFKSNFVKPLIHPHIIELAFSHEMSSHDSSNQSASSPVILDGNATSLTIRNELKEKVSHLRNQFSRAPGLAVILVGDRPDSATYVRMKKKACNEVGIVDFSYNLPVTVSHVELLNLVKQLNNDNQVDGILIQLPLPPQINESEILNEISASKDVDGLHPINIGSMILKGYKPFSYPCTPYGCIEIMKRYNIPMQGKNAVVLGRSNIVGIPISQLLMQNNATVTVCHSHTQNIQEIVSRADIVVAAIGKPLFVKGNWLKPGAVVIDVGINSIPDATKKSGSRLVGDVDYDDVISSGNASAITPVPGGIGPMTIAMLLQNTVNAFERHMK